jgi:hypothetical protein
MGPARGGTMLLQVPSVGETDYGKDFACAGLEVGAISDGTMGASLGRSTQAVSVACLPIFFTGHSISRWEGAVFLGHYVAYVAYVVLAAQQHDALPAFSAAMEWFVIPLTVVTLGVVTWRSVLSPHRRSV